MGKCNHLKEHTHLPGGLSHRVRFILRQNNLSYPFYFCSLVNVRTAAVTPESSQADATAPALKTQRALSLLCICVCGCKSAGSLGRTGLPHTVPPRRRHRPQPGRTWTRLRPGAVAEGALCASGRGANPGERRGRSVLSKGLCPLSSVQRAPHFRGVKTPFAKTEVANWTAVVQTPQARSASTSAGSRRPRARRVNTGGVGRRCASRPELHAEPFCFPTEK